MLLTTDVERIYYNVIDKAKMIMICLYPISANICFSLFSPLIVQSFKDTAVNIEYRRLHSIVQCLYRANSRLKFDN